MKFFLLLMFLGYHFCLGQAIFCYEREGEIKGLGVGPAYLGVDDQERVSQKPAAFHLTSIKDHVSSYFKLVKIYAKPLWVLVLLLSQNVQGVPKNSMDKGIGMPANKEMPDGYFKVSELCPNIIIPDFLQHEVAFDFLNAGSAFCRQHACVKNCPEDDVTSECVKSPCRRYETQFNPASTPRLTQVAQKCGKRTPCMRGIPCARESFLLRLWEEKVTDICSSLEQKGAFPYRGVRCPQAEKIGALNRCINHVCRMYEQEACPYSFWELWKKCEKTLCEPGMLREDVVEFVKSGVKICYKKFCPDQKGTQEERDEENFVFVRGVRFGQP